MSTDLDFDDRQLCPDGSCIGLIGEDGRCKVCGRTGDGPVPSLGTRERTSAEMPTAEALPDEEGAFEDDEDRRLCPDGACIGLLGSDGKCKVCGLPAGS